MKNKILISILTIVISVSSIFAQIPPAGQPPITLVTSQSTIAEDESFTVTATIAAPISEDIVVGLESDGTAAYDEDFTSNYEVIIKTVAGGNGYGSAQNQLYSPYGVFVDDLDNVYVADMFNSRIQKWVPGAIEGETVISGVSNPLDVFVDNLGIIYVLEQSNHQITKWVSGASSGEIVAGGNGPGNDANQLYNPYGLFVDKTGNVYVADSDNHRIQKWAPGSIEGITVAGGNGSGSAQNQLNYPRGVFVDDLDNVYVAGGYNGRIQKWEPGATEGETVVGGISNAFDVSVDVFGSIYVLEINSNKVTKWVSGASSGEIVAGGNGLGNDANQLYTPYDLFVDKTGGIYVADAENHRIQKYEISPQIVIEAGETTAELLFSGIEDAKDENDETIVLNTTATNGTLSGADPIEVTLTDINEMPTVAFTFSEEAIVENSSTDVTLTATLSSVSAKDITIDFALEGSAVETTDYVVSSKSISILAGSQSGNLTISTKDLDDALVEVLDSIVFKVATIVNATAISDSAILYLESDDEPTISLVTSQTTIAENESFTVTATIEAATSQDIVVGLESIGTATYAEDYTSNSEVRIKTVAGGNGYGYAQNQLFNPQGVFVDNLGNVYVADSSAGRIQKWAPDATEGETVISSVNYPVDVHVDVLGNIYVLEYNSQQVSKWIPGSSSGEIVAGGNGNGNAANQLYNPYSLFVNEIGDIYVTDTSNSRIQKWTPGATEGITVAGGNESGSAQNQLNYPQDIFVDDLDNIYVADSNNNRIQKWAFGATIGETVVSGVSHPIDVFVDGFRNIYVLEQGNNQVSKWTSSASSGEIVAGGNGYGSNPNQLNYPRGLFVNNTGDIYLADTENQRIQKYETTPQLVIKAGETTAELLFSGIEDTRDENEETIVLNTTASNAILGSADPIEVALTDINEEPTVAFAFSEEKITENSPTDVMLTATLSSVSAKDVTIDFAVEGSAVELTDYVISSKSISILAGSPLGTLTISTKDLDDAMVEVLDSIVFKVTTIINATAPIDSATLYLESDDDPNLVITTSTDVIAEHQSFNIVATIDAPTSKDVVVGLESIGTARYAEDFESNSELRIKTVAGGNGYGPAQNQLNYPRGIFIDDLGSVYVADGSNNRIQKWVPGLTEGETVVSNVSYPWDVFVDAIGNIYILEPNGQQVTKWASGASSGEIVAGGNGYGSDANQLYNPYGFFVDKTGNVFVADTENHRIQKWEPGATEGETVVGGVSQPIDVSVDASGNVYVLEGYDNYKVTKWRPGTSTGEIVAGGNGSGNNANQLSFSSSLFVDKTRNIYVADSENNRIQKYETTPQIVVKAGETEGILTVSGIEDELNDEEDELIVLKKTVQNAILEDVEDLSVTLLNNSKTLTLKESPFMGVSEGGVAWGDYDRDGDKDVVIMGQSNIFGAVTILYENVDGAFVDTHQDFAKLYGGDIAWVDINKDGWIDLVVSGFDGAAPQTKVYMNNEGASFEPTNDFGLPSLFSTKMAWGDLDNDGDIDLAIAGQDVSNEYVFHIYYKEDGIDNFEKDPAFTNGGTYHQGFINGDLKVVDIDLDGDNDIIYNGQNSSGSPVSGYVLNSYVRTSLNTSELFHINRFDNNSWESFEYENSSIEVAKLQEGQSDHLSIISSGEDSSGRVKLFINDYLYSNVVTTPDPVGTAPDFPLLKNGDISVADYNNDGTNDIVFTGESQEGVPATKLFKQNSSGFFVNSEIELKGLRASTASWVDYDMDGDLDLFLTGVGSDGAETLLYESEIVNKNNSEPEQISGLIAEDLGNGKIRFKWDIPSDDFATNLGYVIRVGTTPGGTELSNTESDLATGARLISKAPSIYTNFYDMQLDPGNYYWSVQAVDPGLKGGVFSAEESFTLTYEWKILNQGGIVDRSIVGVADPVIRLGDVDNDNDLDVIYGSKSESWHNTQLLKFDGKQLTEDSTAPLQYITSITNSEIGDINGDGVGDILMNHWVNSNYQLKVYLSNGSGYNQRNVGNGLYKAKGRIIDLNNDGQAEIFLVGMSSNSLSGVPKIYLYEYDAVNESFILNDVSSQIDPLQYASYDLGDIDNDQDIDFIMSGFNAATGIQSFIYENVTELGGEFTLQKTTNNLVPVKNGTTDLIDFDGDGDLDAIFSGESIIGDVFEIYKNQLNEGISEWTKTNTLPAMREGKIDLGDFDGDGYADLLYSGTFEGSGDITKLSEYDPATKTYVESAFDVSDIVKAEVEFGDLDGDGDLDFVIAGRSPEISGGNDNIFRTYINVRNQSAEVLASKGTKFSGKTTAKITSGTTFTVNNPPSVPIINDIAFIEETDSSVDVPLEFSWQASTDDHTSSVGLTYAIKVGTTPGGEEIMSSNSNSNGVRKDAGKGNVEHNLKWRLSLPEGTYYWSVQAIDASYSGSEFSDSVQFKVGASDVESDSDSDGVLDDVDQCPATPSGEPVDVNGCSESQKDDDNDGVMNNADSCPATPTGETVGVNGCSESQKDDDGDGVVNTLDQCPGTPAGSAIDEVGCSLVEPGKFLIEVVGETCVGKNNGKINITASESDNYTASIDGSNYEFTSVLTIEDLKSGEYSMCIAKADEPDYEQCFVLTVAESIPISGKSIADKADKKSHSETIEMTSGTAPYTISVNGVNILETSSNIFTVDVNHGDALRVSSKFECEGVFEKRINFVDDFMLYPNPAVNQTEIFIPVMDVKEVVVGLYNIQQQLISRKSYRVENNKIILSLESVSAGMYFVELELKSPVTLKVLKQ